MEESITPEVVVDAPEQDNAVDTTPIEGGSEPNIGTDPRVPTTVPDEGETEEKVEVPAKFLNKDGSVNVDNLTKSYMELEKSASTKAEKAKLAQDFEEATGLTLSEALEGLKTPETTEKVDPIEDDNVDKEEFRRLVYETLGDDLESLEKNRTQSEENRLKTKYSDFSDYDKEMAAFVKARPDLFVRKENGRNVTIVKNMELAYLAAKGSHLEDKTKSAKEEGMQEAFNKVADKEAAKTERTQYGKPVAEEPFTRAEITEHTNNGDVEWLNKNMAEITRQERTGLIK